MVYYICSVPRRTCHQQHTSPLHGGFCVRIVTHCGCTTTLLIGGGFVWYSVPRVPRASKECAGFCVNLNTARAREFCRVGGKSFIRQLVSSRVLVSPTEFMEWKEDNFHKFSDPLISATLILILLYLAGIWVWESVK